MNKTKKGKLKKIAVFCAAVMLALVSVFATLATQKEEIRASAEETTATEERTIYPSENLFDISKIQTTDFISVAGDTISVTNYYSLFVSSSLLNLCPRIIPGIYTFSVFVSSTLPLQDSSASVVLIGPDSSSVYLLPNQQSGFIQQTIEITQEMISSYGVYFYGLPNAVVSWEKLTVNAGEVAYPWLPNLDNMKENAYNQGKTEGYQDASDTLNLGVLKGAKISATFTYDKGTKTITDEDPTFTYNGIDLSVYATKYYEYTPGNDSNTLVSANVTITFADPFVYASFSVGFVGSSASDVYGGKFIGTDGKQYACQRDVSSSGSAFKIDEGKYPENLQVKSLVLRFGRASDTLYGVVMVQAGQYQNGYTNGYNDGLSDKVSYNNGYKDGSSTGYANGYNSGYDAGYFAGLSEPGSNGFFNLITTVIDVPITAFSSLLDFSILGVNMKGFVLSLLSFAALIATVRLVMGKNE